MMYWIEVLLRISVILVCGVIEVASISVFFDTMDSFIYRGVKRNSVIRILVSVLLFSTAMHWMILNLFLIGDSWR